MSKKYGIFVLKKKSSLKIDGNTDKSFVKQLGTYRQITKIVLHLYKQKVFWDK
jgi:hypothetical protein